MQGRARLDQHHYNTGEGKEEEFKGHTYQIPKDTSKSSKVTHQNPRTLIPLVNHSPRWLRFDFLLLVVFLDA